ncbi:Uma2 family endonuclease [Actinomadura sediminis]|uniref:Uma2 family endonuclease n=1 Tax=Actinomadura sediminis TaxID=1038904 RepID=A0ABW3EM69_9ACTN
MSVATVHGFPLPDTPYEMWVRGELDEYLHLPDDGTKVEVVGGEIVVSPSPVPSHYFVVKSIERAMYQAEMADPDFRWESMQAVDLNMAPIKDGYIPDLMIMDSGTAFGIFEDDRKAVRPEQLEAVVEVTSPSNARNDRPPRLVQVAGTKWSAYARSGIPFYLLVERDPSKPGVTLFGEPHLPSGTYETLHFWKFGETVKLPEPLGFEIETERWRPWDE